MKKYSILLAVVALVLASLACQTIMGGGDQFTPPEIPDVNNNGGGSDPVVPTVPPVATEENNVASGGDSEFPMAGDAFNVYTTDGGLTYQTKLSADDVMKFYRDEFGSKGYEEDTSMTITFGSGFSITFTGHDSGKSIYLVGADAGDGSMFVTVTLQ